MVGCGTYTFVCWIPRIWERTPPMLVFSRRAEQTVVFPAIDVTIRVLKVKGAVTKIGIDAPRELEIMPGGNCR